MYPKSLNESITFLFICQGQVDTWHHLRGLSEASSSRNLEKIHFGMSPQQFRIMMRSRKSISYIFVLLERFAWLCENFAWSCETTFHFPCVLQPSLFCFISHDYVKISYGHTKSALRFPFELQQKNVFWSISHDCAKFSYDHAKWKYIIFQLLFVISFFWIHFNHL